MLKSADQLWLVESSQLGKASSFLLVISYLMLLVAVTSSKYTANQTQLGWSWAKLSSKYEFDWLRLSLFFALF